MGVSEHATGAKRHRRRLVGALLVVVVGDIVGLLTIPDSSGGEPAAHAPSPTTLVTDPGAVAAVGATPGQEKDGGVSAAPGASVPTTAPLQPRQAKGWDFPATLTPICAGVGQAFTLTLGLGHKGTSVLTVMYADGDARNTRAFGEGGPDGTYSFTWVAASAPGEGMVIIAASNPGRTESGTKALSFRVVATGQKC